MINVEPFRQSDSRWSDLKLTDTLTMRSDGCFYVSLCAALYVHLRMNPFEFYRLAKENGLIGFDGQMNWWQLGAATDGKCFVTEYRHTSNRTDRTDTMDIGLAIARIDRQLSLGQAVIGHVDAVKNDGLPDHAILICDRIRDERTITTDYRIMDPITGKFHLFSERYGDIWKKLYGYRALAYPNVTFPEWATKSNIRDGVTAYKAAVLKMSLSKSLMGVAHTYASEIYDSLVSPRE